VKRDEWNERTQRSVSGCDYSPAVLGSNGLLFVVTSPTLLTKMKQEANSKDRLMHIKMSDY